MRQFGIIGNPLEHSFSANYFRDKFLSEHITDTTYDNYLIDSVNEIPLLLKQFPNLEGLNVTSPFKQEINSILDDIDADARQIGAVNTLTINHGKLKGYNTDAPAFLQTVKNLQHRPQNALVLGTGGAASAICFALDVLEIKYLQVSRKPDEGQIIYRDLSAEIISDHDLIINTTPIGMHPNINAAPDIPYACISEHHCLYDLIYNPEETEFIKRGKSHGAKTMNGLEMLIIQAELSWDIWVNREA